MPEISLTHWLVEGVWLQPGSCTMVTDWSQTRPVNDGFHLCRDTNSGEPLAFPPALYKPESGTWTIRINVHGS